MTQLTILGSTAFVLSLVVCELVRRYSVRRSLLDRPNERSLHTVPVPRLGGTAIVSVTVALGYVVLWYQESPFCWLPLIALAVAGLGLIDDVRPLSARVRFVVQLIASGVLVAIAGVPHSVEMTNSLVWTLPSAVLAVLAVIWIAGLLNVYNFMDGMDGLAGSQAIFASATLALLFARASAFDLMVLSLLLGGASAGFLAHNMPPARIFMGDAGSTFVGFVFGGLVLIGASHGVRVTESALALAPFLLDGTFTILRRASRREPVWKAHRTHLYQRAVAAGLSHREVLLVYFAWMSLSMIGALVARENCLVAWGAALVELTAMIVWVTVLETRHAAKQGLDV